ncbi:MAG: hypothetical protein CL922_05350 [Deltaproteobacteria bacterium]|nr:hypothetical protein [Deltaproteobacteria bacterium]
MRLSFTVTPGSTSTGPGTSGDMILPVTRLALPSPRNLIAPFVFFTSRQSAIVQPLMLVWLQSRASTP